MNGLSSLRNLENRSFMRAPRIRASPGSRLSRQRREADGSLLVFLRHTARIDWRRIRKDSSTRGRVVKKSKVGFRLPSHCRGFEKPLRPRSVRRSQELRARRGKEVEPPRGRVENSLSENFLQPALTILSWLAPRWGQPKAVKKISIFDCGGVHRT